MTEKMDFLKKLRSRLSNVEKDSLYQKLHDSVQEGLLLRHVCQNLEEGVLLLDSAGITRFINRKAEAWFSLPGRFPANNHAWDLSKDTRLGEFLEKSVGGMPGRIVSDVKILFPRETELRVTFAPYAVNGETGILVLLADITTRSEQEFESAMLQRMESLIRLAGGIAHEIGNPLNAITIHLELLKKRLKGLPEPKRDEIEDNLNDIQQETKRLDRIIRNFLKATRKPPLRFRIDNLNDVIADAVSFLRPELESARIRIQFARDSELPAFLMDRERLYYAFMNLIKNAMEAMRGGGELKIAVTHKGNCAIVSIRDTGCGIPAKDFQKIFDIYYTTKEEGSGLGLMMVYDAVTEHGGRIEVTSKLKKGTTFKVFLPVREPQKQLPNYPMTKGGMTHHA